MNIDFKAESPNKRYHFMTQTIIPRPIAWVLSKNEDESLNLAPFSFFNGISSDPPLMMLSIGKKKNGEVKDTRKNILSGRPFIIHLANIDSAAALSNSAAELDYGESELKIDNLALAGFDGYAIPRLKDCDIAYACTLYEFHQIGLNQNTIIYAEIQQLYINDNCILESNGRYEIDAEKINPLSRLGGANYAGLTKPFSLLRPK